MSPTSCQTAPPRTRRAAHSTSGAGYPQAALWTSTEPARQEVAQLLVLPVTGLRHVMHVIEEIAARRNLSQGTTRHRDDKKEHQGAAIIQVEQRSAARERL